MLFYLICLIIVGVICLIIAMIGVYQKKSLSNILNVFIIGLLLLLIGIIPLVAYMQDEERLASKYFTFLFGMLFLYIWMKQIIDNVRCKTLINAIYIKSNEYRGTRGGTWYAPVFSYDYEGKHYEKQTSQSYSSRFVDKHLQEMMQYPIMINPKHPEIFIIKKKKEILLLIVSIFIISVGFLI